MGGRGRYALATAANLAAVGAFTSVAARRLGGPLLSAPNALTLTRAGAAAMLCGTAFSGRGRRPALWALLAGCTVCDWLDGPLARRRGPTPLGAMLDLEADSWLTLWGAVAAYRLRGLPAASLLPPALRYVAAGAPAPPLAPWQRAAGVAQMVVIAGALSPWRPPRALAAIVAGAQLVALGAATVRQLPPPGGGGSGWRGSSTLLRMDPLPTLFRHHAWATLQLIDHCANLPAEKLDVSAPGDRGSTVLGALEMEVPDLSGWAYWPS